MKKILSFILMVLVGTLTDAQCARLKSIVYTDADLRTGELFMDGRIYKIGPNSDLSFAGFSRVVSQETIPRSWGDAYASSVDLSRVDLSGANLTGANLTGFNLTGANLTGANLTGANLREVNLSGADLTEANLTGANLSYFRKSDLLEELRGADLTGANLTGANLTGANLFQANLSEVDLTGANLDFVKVPKIDNIDKAGALPEGYQFTKHGEEEEAYILGPNIDFSLLEVEEDFPMGFLRGVDLTGVDLTGVNFSGLMVGSLGVFFPQDSITGVPSALPEGFQLINGALIGPNVNLTYRNLEGIDLTGVDLTGVNLRMVRSGGITGVPVGLPEGTQLINGYLIGPNVDLSGANLAGVDLSEVNLNGVMSKQITGVPSALPEGYQLTNGFLIGPNVHLSGDLTGVDLSEANLDGVRSDFQITGVPSALPEGYQVIGSSLVGPNVDLSGRRLSGDLTGVDLTGANLRSVRSGGITGVPVGLPEGYQLINDYLIGPNVNLSGANLKGADLRGINITGADLSGAKLNGANLSGVDLTGVNLSYAKLGGANLSGVDLTEVNLRDADLNGAILSGADLDMSAYRQGIFSQDQQLFRHNLEISSNTAAIDAIATQLATLVDALAAKDAEITELNGRITRLENAGAGGIFDLLIQEKDAEIANLKKRPTQEELDTVVAERDARSTLEEIQDTRAGSVIFAPDENGNVQLELEVEESSDLEVWVKQGKSLKAVFPLLEGKKFMRFVLVDNG